MSGEGFDNYRAKLELQTQCGFRPSNPVAGTMTGWDYADFVSEIDRLIEAAGTSHEGEYGALVLGRAMEKLGARTSMMAAPDKI